MHSCGVSLVEPTRLITNPAVCLLILLGLAYILYRAWEGYTPKPRVENGKTQPYLSGEDRPFGMVAPSYHFYFVAFFFTILHVTALVISTVPGELATLGVAYVALVGFFMLAMVKLFLIPASRFLPRRGVAPRPETYT